MISHINNTKAIPVRIPKQIIIIISATSFLHILIVIFFRSFFKYKKKLVDFLPINICKIAHLNIEQ